MSPADIKRARELAEAHRRIEAALPEDEPDHVPDWVCELLIEYGRSLAQEQQAPVAWATMLGSYAHIQWGEHKPDDSLHSIPLYAQPQQAKNMGESDATIGSEAGSLGSTVSQVAHQSTGGSDAHPAAETDRSGASSPAHPLAQEAEQPDEASEVEAMVSRLRYGNINSDLCFDAADLIDRLHSELVRVDGERMEARAALGRSK